MRLFAKLYDKMLQWTAHRHAPYYLFVLSFAESSFFPLPPDIMLIPMMLAQPRLAWRYATLTTVASVLGGLLGYWIGWIAFDWVHPYIIHFGYENAFLHIEQSFREWNFWILFLAGFTPLPYKLFTIVAGTLHVSLLPFILGSLIGRGGRFYLLAFLLHRGGAQVDKLLRLYIDRLSWFILGALLLIIVYLKWLAH